MSTRYIFIVSTPRAGSTLLQSLIMGLEGVTTTKESHFYSLLHYKNLFKPRFYKKRQILIENTGIDLSFHPFQTKLAIQQKFKYSIDSILRNKNKSIFLEKTPMHLKYVDTIRQDFEKAVFIHIMRTPYENVRSLYFAAMENPKDWTNKRSIKNCIARWKNDFDLHKKYQHDENHIFIKYEDLKHRKNEILNILEKKIGAKYSKTNVNVSQIIGENESWKSNNLSSDWSTRNYENEFMSQAEFYENNQKIEKNYQEFVSI